MRKGAYIECSLGSVAILTVILWQIMLRCACIGMRFACASTMSPATVRVIGLIGASLRFLCTPQLEMRTLGIPSGPGALLGASLEIWALICASVINSNSKADIAPSGISNIDFFSVLLWNIIRIASLPYPCLWYPLFPFNPRSSFSELLPLPPFHRWCRFVLSCMQQIHSCCLHPPNPSHIFLSSSLCFITLSFDLLADLVVHMVLPIQS